LKIFRDWSDQQLTDEDALKQYERCQRQEQNFGDLFTCKLNKLKNLFIFYSSNNNWSNSRRNLCTCFAYN